MWEYEKDIKKKNSTWAYNKYSISNEFDTKRFSFLPSVMVSFKQVSNI